MAIGDFVITTVTEEYLSYSNIICIIVDKQGFHSSSRLGGTRLDSSVEACEVCQHRKLHL